MVNHEQYMELALAEAEAAAARGEVPVGAVLVHNGIVIAQAGNTREGDGDALGHAELTVLRQGCRVLGDWRLVGCTLYVTLEPCPMCAGAMVNARIDRVVYGAADPAMGCVGSKIHLFDLDFNHRPLVTTGVLAERCTALLKAFFETKR
ncbi:MAG: tRNA adenosine(34) deaminase TadA [Angelakisella sp.]